MHWLRNGIEVMEYLSDTSYDILLVDWMLPKRSGLEIIKEIRDKNIDIPIIMLTAKSQTADKVSGLNIGADDYLTKPFEFEELEDVYWQTLNVSLGHKLCNKILKR